MIKLIGSTALIYCNEMIYRSCKFHRANLCTNNNISRKPDFGGKLFHFQISLYGVVGECLDADIKLKSSERKVSKLEAEAAALSSDLSKSFRELEATRGEKTELQRSLERVRASLEDQREEGTELISKVTTQSAEIVRLQEFNASLQGKLGMAELLLSQQVCFWVCSVSQGQL